MLIQGIFLFPKSKPQQGEKEMCKMTKNIIKLFVAMLLGVAVTGCDSANNKTGDNLRGMSVVVNENYNMVCESRSHVHEFEAKLNAALKRTKNKLEKTQVELVLNKCISFRKEIDTLKEETKNLCESVSILIESYNSGHEGSELQELQTAVCNRINSLSAEYRKFADKYNEMVINWNTSKI